MNLSTLSRLLIAFLAMVSLANAQLSPYSQNFEDLVIDDLGALSGDGWEVFGFVYDGDPDFPPNGNVKFPYGPFPAPNASAPGVPPAFSAVGSGAAGPAQGMQYLNVFSDYECCSGGQGHRDESMPYDRVQSIVFQTQEIGATDIGSIWAFSFDGRNATDDMGAPRGCDTDGSSDCTAFIKTIDPVSGFQTNLVPFDSSTLSNADWSRHTIQIDLSDPLLEGQLLQFGFESIAEQFGNTGVYYDNLAFALQTSVDCDFDGMTGANGFACDVEDINMLMAEIASGMDNPDFDLNGDNVVDNGDRDQWLDDAGNMNIGAAYLVADFNLDGDVDGQDFVAWNGSKFTTNTDWTAGNANGDFMVDGQDFVLWNGNKFTSSTDGINAVPEPAAGFLILLAASFGLCVRRTQAVRS